MVPGKPKYKDGMFAALILRDIRKRVWPIREGGSASMFGIDDTEYLCHRKIYV